MCLLSYISEKVLFSTTPQKYTLKCSIIIFFTVFYDLYFTEVKHSGFFQVQPINKQVVIGR